MSNLLFQSIDQISREKGIDPQIVIDAIEDAIVVASRKYFKSEENLRAKINSESGEIEVFAVKKVVDTVEDDQTEISLEEAKAIRDDVEVEDEIEFQKPTSGLGRIAAQMAKQVIFQKVREAEERKRLCRIPRTRWRNRQLRRQAVRERRHYRRTRQDRRAHPEARPVEAGKLRYG